MTEQQKTGQQALPINADTPKLVSRSVKVAADKSLKCRGFSDKGLLDIVEVDSTGRERIVLQLYIADCYSAAWIIEHAARELAEAVKQWHATHPQQAAA